MSETISSVRVIVVLGVGGVGKSTASDRMAAALRARGSAAEVIRFDELRKKLAPPGVDPFSKERWVKEWIYSRATEHFRALAEAGEIPIVDCGLTAEKIRVELKASIPGLRIVHLYCPLALAVWRDTKRSILGTHERGRFLHLRALFDRLTPWKPSSEWFPQPGITYAFEYPHCADVHINTRGKTPQWVAGEALRQLGFGEVRGG
ncbi:MAG: AAA family ATPase [Bryobacterales bacterium]|nr:AAA family ATPase [Bryobacterales bacterium]